MNARWETIADVSERGWDNAPDRNLPITVEKTEQGLLVNGDIATAIWGTSKNECLSLITSIEVYQIWKKPPDQADNSITVVEIAQTCGLA